MPENKTLEELMAQAEAIRSIPVEGSCEWFDDMIPKAQKLLQQIQQEQTANSTQITSQMFNKVRDCCDSMDRYIQNLKRIRDNLEKQKNNVIKSQMSQMSVHKGAYSSIRGLFGK